MHLACICDWPICAVSLWFAGVFYGFANGLLASRGGAVRWCAACRIGGRRCTRTRPRAGPSHCAHVLWAAGGSVWWAPKIKNRCLRRALQTLRDPQPHASAPVRTTWSAELARHRPRLPRLLVAKVGGVAPHRSQVPRAAGRRVGRGRPHRLALAATPTHVSRPPLFPGSGAPCPLEKGGVLALRCRSGARPHYPGGEPGGRARPPAPGDASSPVCLRSRQCSISPLSCCSRCSRS
jgi:hypothetical protein